MKMLEVELSPAPGLATFDGHVLEHWSGRLDKSSIRWHVRFLRGAWCAPPDRNGRSVLSIELEGVGRCILGTVEAPHRPAAETLVRTISMEVARRSAP